MSRRQTFSERHQLVVQPAVQLSSMDERLRNGIWNTIYTLFLEGLQGYFYIDSMQLHGLWRRIWHEHFRFRTDEMPTNTLSFSSEIKRIFLEIPWNRVYDLLEAIYRECNYSDSRESFSEQINEVLKNDGSGYRLINGTISPIVSDQEIAEIVQAVEYSEPFSEHIHRALQLLSDRENPDYRNSIKESISAVESLCFRASGLREFDKAIKKLQRQIGLHGALGAGFTNLYGYTSNAQGIRHALMDEGNLEFEDAHFFMIACTAFVNYVQFKLTKTKTPHD